MTATPTPGAGADLTIRSATPSDSLGVGALLNQVWRTEYESFVPPELWESTTAATHAAETRARLSEPDPLLRAVVAFSTDNQAIVGWALSATSRSPQVGIPRTRDREVYQLYVARSGLGLGKRLLDRVLTPGEAAELWVFVENQAAQRFYRREGFVPDGHRHIYRAELAGGVEELRLVR